VHVDIAREAGALHIDIADLGRTGEAQGAAITGSGTGLRAMAERVASCGGDLRYGPAGRGFRVHARLPLDERAAA
jgi:signal transduction histidine kinase